MHPLLSARKTTLLYFAAWFLMGCVLVALLVVSGVFPLMVACSVAFPLILLYAFVNLSSYFLCRVFPLGTTPFARILAVFFVAGFLSSAIWTAAGNGWAWLLEHGWNVPSLTETYSRQVPVIWGIGVLLFLLTGVVHYVIITFERTREMERQSYELRLLAQEAELRLLRAQIDPHFLFNSLNSISALIGDSPAEAREMSFRLADFLRESLRIGTQPSIPLRTELQLLSDYLSIEKVRFGARLGVDIRTTPEALQVPIPPLILQPLVENAIRHGIAQLTEGGHITIDASVRPAGLTIRVQNPCDPERPKRPGTGIGLANVRSRMQSMYAANGRVDVEQSDAYFGVTILIPLG